mgnify:CR=1 FL=1
MADEQVTHDGLMEQLSRGSDEAGTSARGDWLDHIRGTCDPDSREAGFMADQAYFIHRIAMLAYRSGWSASIQGALEAGRAKGIEGMRNATVGFCLLFFALGLLIGVSLSRDLASMGGP